MSSPREKALGRMANFLLPSLKIKPLEKEVHDFLLKEYGGFTVTAGMISGYWMDDDGHPSYGEHKEYKVAVQDKADHLKAYLAELAKKLGENCIYLELGDHTFFIYSK